jgi:UDP-GlcNAc:undecaprenyl-phosphate GlcNAc-1-phosphate transferase
MTPIHISGLVAAILAAGVAILAFPAVVRIAMAVRAVDYPGGRRLQETATPRMGGIAIAAGIFAGSGLPILMLWRQWGWKVTPLDIAALFIGTGLIFLVGLIDDVIGLSPIKRLLVQVLAALVVIYAGWSFGKLYIPFWGEVELGFWGGLITLVWIVGVTNAINLLDGLDGLAGGVAAIIGTSLLAFALIQGNTLMVIVTSATVGACLGFLRHNWAPARIYMGDSGSLTLGFLLAVVSLHASIKGAATVAILVPLLALGLPVIDTLLVMVVRFAAKPQGSHVRRFASMFRADRNHVHHLMARAAPERKEIVFVIYFVAAFFCVMAMAVSISRSASLGLALVVIEVIVVLLMRNIGVRREARALSLEQRRQLRETFFKDGSVTESSHPDSDLVSTETRTNRAS